MARTNEAAAIETVLSSVQFTVNTGETPVSLVKNPGEGAEDRKGTFEWRDIVVHDARPMADQIDLDGEGFEFVNYETAVENFLDDDEVRRVYYPEMERLVIEATGCAKVIVFDHTVRVGDEAKQAAHKVRAPVRVVHNDFTLDSAPQRVRDLLPAAEAEARLAKRYGSINIWRPISGPVENDPLVVCGWRSLAQDDMIRTERHYNDRVGAVFNVAYNADQRWSYFPRMETGEVVLLKCFDSLTDGTARWTAHGSFDNPNAPASAPPRESIEIRTLYFFD
jgi:hypothetical protein